MQMTGETYASRQFSHDAPAQRSLSISFHTVEAGRSIEEYDRGSILASYLISRVSLSGQNIAQRIPLIIVETHNTLQFPVSTGMQSNDTDEARSDAIESAECISSISIDLIAESGKNIQVQAEKCETLGTSTETDLSGVLKDLGSALRSTTTLLSPSVLNSTIGTLGHNANFNTSTTDEMLVDEIRPVETVEFAEDHSSTEATIQALPTMATSVVSGAVTVIPVNTNLPQWAARLKDCEMIGDSYRGYVNTESELDLLLSIHKEHTQSCWGTRQSPSSAKPSVRLMWKSQYVPYDGIPFLNSGRRAIVMECQYGPRRKGSKVKMEFNDNVQQLKKVHRPTCPARIYIKRVRKFPKYRIDPNYEGIAGTRQAQERALAELRSIGIENGGEERFYVQFPLEIAHEYHHDDEYVLSQQVSMIVPTHTSAISRLDSRVVEKINELVARGVTEMYEVKHGVIHFVEKELFNCSETFPPRHNKTYFPTITDLQNHIYQAKLALEAGTLASLPPPEILPKTPTREERSRKRKRSEPRRVRTLKTTAFEPIGTLCIQADQLGIQRDGDLEDSQAPLHVTSTEEVNQLGQVFVMVPSSNSLFTTTDSIIGSSTNKATSLVQMQVVTVPTAGSGYLTQQGDGTLGLSGQYLSLPVNSLPIVSYGDNQEISLSESQNAVDSLGKEITSLMPSSIGEQTIQQQTSHHHETSPENLPTTTAPISPMTIAIVTPDITVCDNTSEPTMSDRIQSFTKCKDPVIIDAIDKNPTVDYLFGNENQATTKSSCAISSTNADMNSMPISTEESYNSSLDIIKTHEEITSVPPSDIYQDRQSFSRTLDNHSSKESPQEISSTTGALKLQSNDSLTSELL